MNTTVDRIHTTTSAAADKVGTSPAYQAYRILHFGFVVAPILAGLDKFFHLLANWDQYLPGVVARMSPVPPHTLMLVVGVIEIVAGLIVLVKPRIGAYIVGLWLLGIIANLLTTPEKFYDIALRDFGLALGAFALGRLAEIFDRHYERADVPV